jgi:hypothetical protein
MLTNRRNIISINARDWREKRPEPLWKGILVAFLIAVICLALSALYVGFKGQP